MYKHGSPDPATIARSKNGKMGLIARTIAYDIFKLPHICENCGYEGKTEVHHINKNREDNSRENIKILCRSCHNKVHDVILPHKEKTDEEKLVDMLPLKDRRYKLNPKKYILLEKRKQETEKYKEKWGIE